MMEEGENLEMSTEYSSEVLKTVSDWKKKEPFAKKSGTLRGLNFLTQEQVLSHPLSNAVLPVRLLYITILCSARLAKKNSAPSVMKIITVETHSIRESFTKLKTFFRKLYSQMNMLVPTWTLISEVIYLI